MWESDLLDTMQTIATCKNCFSMEDFAPANTKLTPNYRGLGRWMMYAERHINSRVGRYGLRVFWSLNWYVKCGVVTLNVVIFGTNFESLTQL
jgi:hypothetical protein